MDMYIHVCIVLAKCRHVCMSPYDCLDFENTIYCYHVCTVCNVIEETWVYQARLEVYLVLLYKHIEHHPINVTGRPYLLLGRLPQSRDIAQS